MLASTGLAVVNDGGGAGGEARTQANEFRCQPSLTMQIVNGLPDVPEHWRLPTQGVFPHGSRGHAGHQVAVIHPSLNQLRSNMPGQRQDGERTKRVWGIAL